MSAPSVTGNWGSGSPVVLPVELSDSELLSATRRLVGRSNQLLALLLGHLAEVESRGLHRTRACSSLYTYCIYELRFSEDEAYRRVAAARLVRRFPALLDAVASGELHLTGLLMLGPQLTAENLTEVLARAKHRTKKEIAQLVRRLDPLPDVPARIEPLGPAPARVPSPVPTHSQFVESLCPVRDLAPSDRPREWAGQAEPPEGAELSLSTEADSGEFSKEAAPRVNAMPAPARLEPERYRVEFTASEEYVQLVERAQALLSHSTERVPLAELQLRAMRGLVTELERTRRAATKRSAQTTAPATGETHAEQRPRAESPVRPEALARPKVPARLEVPARLDVPLPIPSAHSVSVRSVGQPIPVEPNEDRECPSQRGNYGPEHPRQRGSYGPERPRQRVRYIPATVRRAVFERDQGRCAFIDGSGQRCRETHRLEIHHVRAFARGGEHTVENLALRCHAHNALAAEQDFGADLIQQLRDSSRHEGCRRQT